MYLGVVAHTVATRSMSTQTLQKREALGQEYSIATQAAKI